MRPVAVSTYLIAILLPIILSQPIFAKSINLDDIRGGARLSNIDIDASNYDDTVGVGVFLESPIDSRSKIGTSFDIWSTEDRVLDQFHMSDIAFGIYGKYFFATGVDQINPYGLVGLGLHLIEVDTITRSDRQTQGSLDMGIGIESKLNSYLALCAEMKMRNVNKNDYRDFGLGMIAKF